MTYMYALLALLLSVSCLNAKTFKVMQYNAENFFDTKFDEGTDDYTYLPLSVKATMPGHKEKCQAMGRPYDYDCLKLDWSDKVFNSKIKNISQVIKAYDATGKGPDIVVLEEIENINVLNLLVERGLSGLGYKYVQLIEGDDTRGIDVGILSKFPIVSSKRYSVFYQGKKLNTRGITEVNLNANGISVTVFGNHWPSQNNPVGHRIESAKQLAKVADKKDSDLIVAMGDFNTIAHDSPYPFSYLTNFTDSEMEARKINPDLNPGTHYYRGSWASLDKIFVHRNSRIAADFSTYQIIHESFQMQKDPKTGAMAPKRFNPKSGQGYSDHLPIGISFNY